MMIESTPSTVGELIEALKKFDDDTDFLILTEDEDVQREGHMMRFFEVESINKVECERCRGADYVASVKLGKSDHSVGRVVITMTSDI